MNASQTDNPIGHRSETMASRQQTTLAASFSRSGIGLHSGETTQVWVKPAEPGQGRYFVRCDRPDSPVIPADLASVRQTLLSTELVQGEVGVRTVEHLLAALTGLGIDNARIEINGPEVPLLDGSAQDWVTAIVAAGRTTQSAARSALTIQNPIWVRQEDAFVAALPAPELRFTYGIDFDLAPIGNQWHSVCLTPETFTAEIAPARTFGLLHQIEHLQASGLIKGGSLDNALVCGPDDWVNPPLRFSNEPVRHKLLDLIGDISLLGSVPTAHFLAYKASHQLHAQLVQQILAGDASPSSSSPFS